eukprot:gene4323-4602_t
MAYSDLCRPRFANEDNRKIQGLPTCPQTWILMHLPLILLASAAAPTVRAAAGFITYDQVAGAPYAVTYDNRSLFIDGSRTLLLSGGWHYPRATPGSWDDLMLKAKNDGFNQAHPMLPNCPTCLVLACVAAWPCLPPSTRESHAAGVTRGPVQVQPSVFWNGHQHKPGDWNFEGQYNLRGWIEAAAAHGLFVNLRIGPYICAEWDYGGYPVWLNWVQDLQCTRCDNAVWEREMGTFVNRIVNTTRDLFADKGGPIILAQVENEYRGSQTYVDWCGQLAKDTGVQIPWEMCNGMAAANTINSCNGGDCTGFIESHGQNGRVLIDQPALWTEDWIGWYQQWDNGSPPGTGNSGEASQKAASVANLHPSFHPAASPHGYNMWFGGNNYDRPGAGTMN